MSDRAREIIHKAYMQGFRDGRLSVLAERRQGPRRRLCVALLDRLSGGPKPAKDIIQWAQDEGVSSATLKRAKVEINIVSEKRADGWYWSIQGDQGDQSVGT